MKVLFLDIDGVLNGHEWDDEAKSCTIRRECVAELNRVVKATGVKLVISSAWRYMVLGGAMRLDGFGYMLRTHGLIGASSLVIDTTGPDQETFPDGATMRFVAGERGRQVRAWLDAHPEATAHLAIDDEDHDFAAAGVRFLKTDGKRGLTVEDADRAIAMLGRAE